MPHHSSYGVEENIKIKPPKKINSISHNEQIGKSSRQINRNYELPQSEYY